MQGRKLVRYVHNLTFENWANQGENEITNLLSLLKKCPKISAAQ